MPPRPRQPVLPNPPGQMLIGQAIAFGTMVLLVACVYRLIWLERHEGQGLRDRAERQYAKIERYPARRGSIYDFNPVNPAQHSTLACSYELQSVFLDATFLRDSDHRRELIRELAAILKLSATAEGKLLQRVAREFEDTRPGESAGASVPPALADPDEPEVVPDSAGGVSRCIYVKRKIPNEQSEAVRRLVRARKWQGIGLEPTMARLYPMNELASHQVGFLDSFGAAKAGLELVFDSELAGKDGRKKTIASALRQPLWSSERDYEPPEDGKSLVLHVNAVIQGSVERTLKETVEKYKAESGVAVVMDVTTGGLLAIANYPTFSLSEYNTSVEDHRKNRALGDPYEPGSIFKWVTVAGAMDRGVVRETDVFDCEGGSWKIPNCKRKPIHDVHGYGELTVRMILVKSSNVGMAKIGMKFEREKGKQAFSQNLLDFGFRQKTGIELGAGEDTGSFPPTSQWKYGYSVPSISFGQGISVTPIQMVRAFAAICNGGKLLRPRLVRAVVDDSAVSAGGDLHVLQDFSLPTEYTQILSARTSQVMRDILCEVVTKGTGQKAKSEKYTIFGKTGTAQIAEGGNYIDRYVGSFICGAPAERPRIAVLVSIRKPTNSLGYYGGTVAAPACKQIVESTLEFLQVPANPPKQTLSDRGR